MALVFWGLDIVAERMLVYVVRTTSTTITWPLGNSPLSRETEMQPQVPLHCFSLELFDLMPCYERVWQSCPTGGIWCLLYDHFVVDCAIELDTVSHFCLYNITCFDVLWLSGYILEFTTGRMFRTTGFLFSDGSMKFKFKLAVEISSLIME